MMAVLARLVARTITVVCGWTSSKLLRVSSDGSVLKDKFPRLYALEMNKDCKAKERGQVVNKTWIGEWVWRIPPRVRAQDDLAVLSSLLNATVFSNNRCDKWWNSWIPKKINVMVWKASLNILATRPNLIARGVALPSSNCPLCDSKVEDIEHILVKCPNVRNLNIQGCPKIVEAINGVFQITLWAVWSWRNRLTHAIGDGIIKIKNKDLFPGIQRISKLWMSARIRSNVKADWKCWVAKPFGLFS
ncbi:RNA-directed DNA polymerase, eukaryota, reverse transcriptase zinc-binding domain protein, partial [Tanacetum coccineum]